MVDARAKTPESEPDENMLGDDDRDIDQSPRSDHGPDVLRPPVLPSDGGAEIENPIPSPWPCHDLSGHGPGLGLGRQRAHASVAPMHPAAVLGKMADLPFRLASGFVGEISTRYVVAPGVQADGIDTMEQLVGMKRAASQISRSQYEIYNFATKHDLSESATDELLMLVGNVGVLYYRARCFSPKGITHASSLFRFDFHLKASLGKP